MHRWILPLLIALPACKDDSDPCPSSPSCPGSASVVSESASSGEQTAGDSTSGAITSGQGPTGTGTDSAGSTTAGPGTDGTATLPTNPTNDPTNGPDPTETAFIVDQTTSGDPTMTDPTMTMPMTTQMTMTDPTGGDPTYGNCGWAGADGYYDCANSGGSPGVEDPSGVNPIACMGDLMGGGMCDEQNGPVKFVGCCAPGGTLYYCDQNQIVETPCG